MYGTSFILFILISKDVQSPESREFEALEGLVSEKTLKGIADMGFTEMMEIQHKSIVPLLKGRSVKCTSLIWAIIECSNSL